MFTAAEGTSTALQAVNVNLEDRNTVVAGLNKILKDLRTAEALETFFEVTLEVAKKTLDFEISFTTFAKKTSTSSVSTDSDEHVFKQPKDLSNSFQVLDYLITALSTTYKPRFPETHQ